MSQWFRLYECTLDDPKVQRLSADVFKSWVNILCLACRHEGILPALAHVSFALRKSEAETDKLLSRLGRDGLLDESPAGLSPHNWNGRQYKSDVSTNRVKQHRERRRNVSSTVTETPSESEQNQSRTDSGAKAPAGEVPARDLIFAEGLPWISERSGKDCRSLVAKWCHTHGDEVTLRLLREAQAENPVDPVSWISARFAPKLNWADKRAQEIQDAIRTSKEPLQ